MLTLVTGLLVTSVLLPAASAAAATSKPSSARLARSSSTAPYNSWAMTSQRGDYIGQGTKYSFSSVKATGSDTGVNLSVTVGADSFDAQFSPPSGDTFADTTTPVPYVAAEQYPQGSEPALSVLGGDRSCSDAVGWFEVWEASFDPSTGDVDSLLVTFDQHCNHALPALLGSIAYEAPDPAEAVPAPGHGPRVTTLKASAGASSVKLSWKDPTTNFTGVVVTYLKQHAAPKSPVGLSVACGGYADATTDCIVQELKSDTGYGFSVFAIDESGDPSIAATVELTGTAIALSQSASLITPGQPVLVSIHLTTSGKHAPVRQARVAMYGRLGGASPWRLVERAVTNAVGTVRVTIRPVEIVQFEFVFTGSGLDLGSTSSTDAVAVKPFLTASLSTDKVARGGTLYCEGWLKGDVTPIVVNVEELENSYWVSIAHGTARGNDVHYDFKLIAVSSGTYHVRVQTDATDHYFSATSQEMTVTVT